MEIWRNNGSLSLLKENSLPALLAGTGCSPPLSQIWLWPGPHRGLQSFFSTARRFCGFLAAFRWSQSPFESTICGCRVFEFASSASRGQQNLEFSSGWNAQGANRSLNSWEDYPFVGMVFEMRNSCRSFRNHPNLLVTQSIPSTVQEWSKLRVPTSLLAIWGTCLKETLRPLQVEPTF